MREVVGIFELEPIETSGDSSPLRLRIEIIRLSEGRFTARLLRWEMYEVKPFDLRDEGDVAHEAMLVEDVLPGERDVDTATEEDALREALHRLRKQLGNLPQLR